MVVRTSIDVERKKALDFLAGDPHVTLTPGRIPVRPDKEKNEGEKERLKEKVVAEEKNPRLKTEAYLKQIGKL